MNWTAVEYRENLFARTRIDKFAEQMAELLRRIIDIDTSPSTDISSLAARENEVFGVLSERLRRLRFNNAETETRDINPSIAKHPSFSTPYYTKSDACPEGMNVPETYNDRHNLLYFVPGSDKQDSKGRSLAVNAHIDVVAPWFPSSREGATIFGRGACDDKGACVTMVMALEMLCGLLEENGSELCNDLTCMLVIEEEMGGNGSLSLALDRGLKKRYESLLVLECADGNIHPANRGALWYRTVLKRPGVSLLEMASFVIEELEKEGRAIRGESRHHLFPDRPVQTCHGVIGPWGEHPSRICGRVAFTVDYDHPPGEMEIQLVRDVLDFSLEAYTGIYGDWTKSGDRGKADAKVDHHYDLAVRDNTIAITVHGSTGHMGATFENDNAITKMAWLVRGLVRSRSALSVNGSLVQMRLAGATEEGRLVLEGGQGFVPTHDLSEVMTRLTAAVDLGAANYLRFRGLDPGGEPVAETTYEKLHNAAFDGDPDSPSMGNAVAAARECGMWRETEIRGWTVSCDARIFAAEYPGMPVLTSGAGSLANAHSDSEQIDLNELRTAIEFLVLYILKETGTI